MPENLLSTVEAVAGTLCPDCQADNQAIRPKAEFLMTSIRCQVVRKKSRAAFAMRRSEAPGGAQYVAQDCGENCVGLERKEAVTGV